MSLSPLPGDRTVRNRSLPFLVVAALALAGGCSEDPTSYDDLSRGTFAGVNTGLLSTLISNTTAIEDDTATGVVVAAEIGASRYSGEAPPRRHFRGLGLFSIDGTAKPIGGLSANDVALPFVPDSPPAHYELDTTAPTVLSVDRRVRWLAGWTTGESIQAAVALPPSFGSITLSSGRDVSIARLDAGDTLKLQWTGVVPKTRVFIYVSWRPAVAAPTLVVPPLQALAVEDIGEFAFPGGHLGSLIRQRDGYLTFVLYRGRYETAATFDNGTKSLGAFSFVSDSVRVDLVE
jgi:hypothetical protein